MIFDPRIVPMKPTTPTANTNIPDPMNNHVIISIIGSSSPTFTAWPRLEISGFVFIHIPTTRIATPNTCERKNWC